MRKRLFAVLSVLVLASCLNVLPATAAIHSNVPQDVEKYAETVGLSQTKQTLAIDPKGEGLKTEDIPNLTVGPGLQLNSINFGELKNSSDNSLMSKLTPEPEWEFLLEVNGTPKTIMIIAKQNGSFHVDQMGGGDPSDFVKAWNLFDKATSSQVDPVLIQYQEIRLLGGIVDHKEVLIPDQSSARASFFYGMDNTKLWPAVDVVKIWKEQMNQKADPALVGGSGVSPVLSDATNENSTKAWWLAGGIVVLLGIVAYVVRKRRRIVK